MTLPSPDASSSPASRANLTGCQCCGFDTNQVLVLAADARQAVQAAYRAERSRYRSLELSRAAQSLDTLVSGVSQPIG